MSPQANHRFSSLFKHFTFYLGTLNVFSFRFVITYWSLLSRSTVYPQISPLGAYLFLIFLDGGLFEGGGLYEGGGAYKIIVDIRMTLLKDLVYFSKNFVMSI